MKGEYTQNVPLSVTYATAPATGTEKTVDIIGTTSVPELVPTANAEGHITIWNCSRQLKVHYLCIVFFILYVYV